MPGTVLVTGGCGFIGSNYVRHLLDADPDLVVVNLDVLTYAGNPENLADLEDSPRYRFVRGDIAIPADVEGALDVAAEAGEVRAVVNFAAESHVDRSIHDAAAFIRTNVEGTRVLLEASRVREVGRFVQVSTDEVYGSLGPEGAFTETTPLDPSSPYSASKAAADLLVNAYVKTHGLPAVVTRCSNNYGPYQYPEKLIPLMISNALADRPLPVYGDGMNVRDWIHVEDHCEAIRVVMESGRPGEVYNAGGASEMANLDVVRTILAALGKPESLIEFVTDRPGHDRRYAIDFSKMEEEFGWRPAIDFANGIEKTVRWYVENEAWWQRIKSGEFRDYYEAHYASGRED